MTAHDRKRTDTMDVGLQLTFQNTHENGMSDADMFRQETELVILAEALGLDFIQAPEHHFDPGYSMMPDTLQWLAYVAGRTTTITLGCGAIILPWWGNPLRVAEKIAMIDILLEGRFTLGFGRGLAKQEYEIFGVDMNESRGRFDQAAALILDTLDTGIAEWDTEFFTQVRTEIHPRPERGFRERGFYCVAMTPDSGIAAADLGGTMMSFVQLPWEQHHQAVEAWRTRFAGVHPGKQPGAPVFADFTYCHRDPARAEEIARTYLTKYYASVIRHYEFDGSHWGQTQGYNAYQAGADLIREVGVDAAAEAFVQSQAWGTPEQILEAWRERVAMTGELRAALVVSYAGMPFELVRSSLELIAAEVAPELRRLGTQATVGGAPR